MAIDLAAADELLTTTRAVRKRLDFSRPVARETILDCVRISQQAPTGGNSQGWRWIIVDDADKRREVAKLYQDFVGSRFTDASKAAKAAGNDQSARVYEGAQYLADHFHEAPIHVIACWVMLTLGGIGAISLSIITWMGLFPWVAQFPHLQLMGLYSFGMGLVIVARASALDRRYLQQSAMMQIWNIFNGDIVNLAFGWIEFRLLQHPRSIRYLSEN